MPLADEMQIRQDPTEWNSGLCETCTGQRIQDCFCSVCCSFCAFSEECVNLKPYYELGPVPEDCCCTYFDCGACCIFALCSSFPCCAFCGIRCLYRKKLKIKGGCCCDFLATFFCCCCAHLQVDLSTAAAPAARPPDAPAARPLVTSVH